MSCTIITPKATLVQRMVNFSSGSPYDQKSELIGLLTRPSHERSEAYTATQKAHTLCQSDPRHDHQIWYMELVEDQWRSIKAREKKLGMDGGYAALSIE